MLGQCDEGHLFIPESLLNLWQMGVRQCAISVDMCVFVQHCLQLR